MINLAFFLLMSAGTYFIVMLIFAAIFAGGLIMARRGANDQIDQGRRSFLGGRGSADDHALFFGLQMVIQIFGSDQLRARIHHLIETEGETGGAGEDRKSTRLNSSH